MPIADHCSSIVDSIAWSLLALCWSLQQTAAHIDGILAVAYRLIKVFDFLIFWSNSLPIENSWRHASSTLQNDCLSLVRPDYEPSSLIFNKRSLSQEPRRIFVRSSKLELSKFELQMFERIPERMRREINE